MPEMELQAGGLGERIALDLLHGVLRALASAEDTDDVLRVIAGHGVQWLQPVGAVLGRQLDDVVAVGSWGSSLDLNTDSLEQSRLVRNPWSDAVRLCCAVRLFRCWCWGHVSVRQGTSPSSIRPSGAAQTSRWTSTRSLTHTESKCAS